MKKLICLLTFLLLAVFTVYSQADAVTVNLEAFTKIKAYDGLSVNLIKSNENKAVINGANTQKVTVFVDEGVLKVRMQLDRMFSGFRTKVSIHHTEELVVIDVNREAKITSAETMLQKVLELSAQDGGEIAVKAEVEQMLIKAVMGGVVTTTGNSDLQDVLINTGGVYNGKEFQTKFSTITVNAGSKAEIFATDYVKASVKAGGEVIVHGDPTKMDEKTIFGGKITRM